MGVHLTQAEVGSISPISPICFTFSISPSLLFDFLLHSPLLLIELLLSWWICSLKFERLWSQAEGSVDEGAISQTNERDKRSVYVKNVEYSSKQEEIKQFFKNCGEVLAITILKNPANKPKGCCYIEFADEEGVNNALALDGSFFKEREITVMKKRTNVHSKGPKKPFKKPQGRL